MIVIVRGLNQIKLIKRNRQDFNFTVAIVHGLEQPKSVKTCNDIYVHFCYNIQLWRYTFIFDSYNTENYSKRKLKLLLILLDQCQAR